MAEFPMFVTARLLRIPTFAVEVGKNGGGGDLAAFPSGAFSEQKQWSQIRAKRFRNACFYFCTVYRSTLLRAEREVLL